MRPDATRDVAATRKGLGGIAGLFVLLLVLGPLIVNRIALPGVLNPGTGVNTFFEQYRRHEPVFLALMALFAVGVALAARRALPDESPTEPLFDTLHWSAWRLVAVSVAVFAVAAIGTSAVMHQLPLSMDEYAAAFQARVFADGRLAAPLPEAWWPYSWSLTPVFIAYDPGRHVWMSQYLPVYSVLRASLIGIGADRFINPALAAVSLPLIYACARRLWPDEAWRAWLAVGFLAASTQLLFMSMTGYAMPAHLAVDLLWLYAFLRNDRTGWIAAPLLGMLALGIHNPFPHALFVAPFLLYVAWQRRWAWTAYFAATYVAGIALWLWWGRSVHLASGKSLGLFEAPGLLMGAVQEMSFSVMLSWQTPLMAIGLLCAALSWRSLPRIERLLGAGVLLALVFFLFFPSTQGHGWGYRYTYAVLGNMALLAVTGVARLRDVLGRTVVRRAVVASVLATIMIQIPVRAWQVERYVRPFARAHEYIHEIDADVVIIDPTTSWYGIDLVRNDPYLAKKPVVVSAFGLRPELKQALAATYGTRVHLVQPEELARFGLPTYPSRFRGAVWPPDSPPTVLQR
jgi:hypothetical protein